MIQRFGKFHWGNRWFHFGFHSYGNCWGLRSLIPTVMKYSHSLVFSWWRLFFHVSLLLLCSTAFAGDCHRVVQVRAHGYVAKAQLLAVDDYHVTYVATEARARNRIKDLEAEVSELREATKNNAETSKAQSESIRLLTQGFFAAKGADPGVLQAQAPLADPLFAKALPVLQKHCIQCHKAGAEQGETAIFQSNGQPLPSYSPELKGLIELSVADDSMPKNGTKLTADEYQAIRQWATASEADRAAMRAAFKKAAKSNPIPPVPGELK